MASYEQTMIKLEKMAQATNAAQMNWQEKMSKTSHQMEVADLKASGLNPVLSANSGAQSYSTSLDSAASAVGNLASAHESSKATRFAAKQSAAATRAAAAANLAAAREAAAASRYAADKSLEGTKYQTKYNKSGTIPGVASNFLMDVAKSIGNSGGTSNKDAVQKRVQNTMNNKQNYMKNSQGSFTWKNLNVLGRSEIKTELKKLGIQNVNTLPPSVIQNYIDGVYNKNIRAQKRFGDYLSAYLARQRSSARPRT